MPASSQSEAILNMRAAGVSAPDTGAILGLSKGAVAGVIARARAAGDIRAVQIGTMMRVEHWRQSFHATRDAETWAAMEPKAPVSREKRMRQRTRIGTMIGKLFDAGKTIADVEDITGVSRHVIRRYTDAAGIPRDFATITERREDWQEERRAKITRRLCITCQEVEILSEGAHHRMCDGCVRRAPQADHALHARLSIGGRRA